MSSPHAKLAQLRALRPEPATRLTPGELPPEAGGPAHRNLGEGGPARRSPALRDEGGLGELLGAVAERTRYGEHLVVRRWYAEPEACSAARDAVRLLAPDAPEEAADPEQWLFLDTETTGLAGGTGTYVFLAGVAWWDAGGLQVEQFFMRDHTEEHSLLVALAERLAERRVLVTFNGKSFDWPLLETRYRMTRQIRPRPPRAHLDLLHPARQVWRLRLGSVRLTELERQIFGANGSAPAWSRQRDIPSHLIPQAYFDYLRGGAAAPLAAVFEHNRMDLRGLASLAGRLLAMLADPEAVEGDPLELYGLSRLLRRRGERGRARRLYERTIEAGLAGTAARRARRELAALAKRDRDYSRAVSLWQELIADRRRASSCPVQDSACHLEALEQLAIYYEHQAREPERAAALVRHALALLRPARRGVPTGRAGAAIDPGSYRRLEARLAHRLARLTRRSSLRMGQALWRA